MELRVKPKLFEIYYENQPFYIPGFYWREKSEKFIFYTLEEAKHALIALKSHLKSKKYNFYAKGRRDVNFYRLEIEKERQFYSEVNLSKLKIVKYGVVEEYGDLK